MLKKLSIAFVTLFIFGYVFIQFKGYSLNSDKIKNEKAEEIGKYELMKDALINNLDYITSKYQRNYNQGSLENLIFSAGNLTYWIGWESEHPELKQIEIFYDENRRCCMKISSKACADIPFNYAAFG